MFLTTIRPLVVVLLAPFVLSADSDVDYSTAYHECTRAFHAASADFDPVIRACEESAKQGVPGAQFALGALLVNRGSAEDVATGVQWLEKAVSAGSPPAAFHLASALLQMDDEASNSRGRELLKLAICAGYPQALAAAEDAGINRDTVKCAASPETDFSGDWIVSLRWDPSEPSSELTESYKVSIRDRKALVFLKSGDEWVEAKPGKFTFTQLDESATLAVADSGWDFDGKWIESWTLQFLRLSPDESAVAYLRTVNNPHLPSMFSWRTFSNYAEGKAHRVRP